MRARKSQQAQRGENNHNKKKKQSVRKSVDEADHFFPNNKHLLYFLPTKEITVLPKGLKSKRYGLSAYIGTSHFKFRYRKYNSVKLKMNAE